MANKTTNYKLTKPLESEFYDVGVQNENMDKIDTQMKANADAVEALQKGQSEKADLVDGKVPAEQLPDMNYDAKGTAQNKVSEHNLDQTAHLCGSRTERTGCRKCGLGCCVRYRLYHQCSSFAEWHPDL